VNISQQHFTKGQIFTVQPCQHHPSHSHSM